MPKVRKFVAYRRLERPYTRKSKFRKKSFIKVNPNPAVIRFVMGDTTNKKFSFTLRLRSKKDIQIRNLALESGRQTGNRLMERSAGKTGYRFSIRVYPHHILRENPLAAGAGADRMSTGMKHSFGKTIGLAARVKEKQTICQIDCEKNHLDFAKTALKRFSTKMPGKCMIEVVDNKRKAKL